MVDTLNSLLEDILANGIDFLLDEKKRLVNIFEEEWQGEMMAEVNLKKLYAEASAMDWLRPDNPNDEQVSLSESISL